ncbi:MAG: anion transporter [Vicinamibacterales bacterium]
MPAVDPELLSDARVLAAYAIFASSYTVFALGRFPSLKIDRPGAAIIGAVLMVAFGIVDAPQALASIDFSTIVLLFSMMVIVAHVQIAGFFDRVADVVIRRLHPHHLLPVVVGMSGLLSALLVNDVVCLMLTPLVIGMTRRLRVPPVPYVVALATASNIGSVATITGNPQNILIGSISGISYAAFTSRLAPVAALGLVANWAIVQFVYLRGAVDRVNVADALPVLASGSDDIGASRRTGVGRRTKPIVVLAVTIGAFFAGVSPALAAASGAAVLLISRTIEPQQIYDRVDWSLLVFFVGLFVIVGGADRAGLTATLLEPFQAWNLHRLPIFVSATVVLSNAVSNVPAVMLLRTLIPGFPDAASGWLTLSMASTLAGNLTIAGSIANIIVVERAAADGVRIDFRDYARVGVPLTAVTLLTGATWLWLVR